MAPRVIVVGRSVFVDAYVYSVLTASIASTPDFSHKTALLSNKCRRTKKLELAIRLYS